MSETFAKSLELALKQRNRLILLTILLLMMNVSLTLVLLRSDTKVVIIPATESSIIIADGALSEEYLTGMAEFLAGELLNLSPANIDLKRQRITKYLTTANYQEYLAYFGVQTEQIKKFGLSTYFSIYSLEVDKENLRALVKGKLERKVSTKATEEKDIQCLLQFVLSNGTLKLHYFQISQIQEEKK